MSSRTDQFVAQAKAARTNLIVYALMTDPRYRANAFHRFLARELEQAVIAGRGRLMIVAPPQHGKSELVSRKLPAWIMGKFPDWPIIAASYGDDLVELNGGAVRSAIASPMHRAIFEHCELDPSNTAKRDFRTTLGGNYLGVTIRSGGTGFPAKVFIIDDPFRSRADAESPTYRAHVRDWYRSVVYPRLSEDSILIIMHTRWHEDDLAGWLMTEHAQERWRVINLPALAEENDLMGRAPGEPLVPERFSANALNQKRVAVGAREWAALYQGRPQPAGGGVFRRDWLRYYDTKDIPRAVWAMNRYLLVDPARTQKKTSDFTAMAVVGLHVDENYYLLDAVYDRLRLAERPKLLMELHRKWKPISTGYKKTGHEQELEYIEERQNRENYRFPVVPLAESGSKEARIERLAPDFEAGRWWLPGTLWKADNEGVARDLIAQFTNEEFMTFPAGRHDDMLDCLSSIKDIGARFPRVRERRASSPTGALIV
ncbi:terminase family protein [Burkholderia cenocepacia]|uniref:terminase large subunit domain-containing protein n=1 Tax=Burkholderia cenocepacia TaxID=95486 RepID=UPI001BA770C6|nr:terminase family protein [Burkholderia cenocepacia]QUO26154.1 terminase family protein [Burkholderia cenocepacia]